MKAPIRIAVMILVALGIASSAFATKPDRPERNSIELNAHLTAIFPGYDSAPSFTASAYHAEFAYWIEERGKAAIRGEDIPRMVFSDEAHGTRPALTVVVEGIPGTTSYMDWTNYPTVTLAPVELRVKAYEKVASEISTEDRPVLDIILSDLHLSTNETCAEGYCTKGYLDAENLEAQLVFKTELPDARYALYHEWLTGQEMLGELRIQLPNPFADKD